jgi:hypothetical protein
MTRTYQARTFFERLYDIDAKRGDSCDVALDSEGVLHVHVSKVVQGVIRSIEVPITFYSEISK